MTSPRPFEAMPETSSQGIVLVIPKVGTDSSEHFSHTYALARNLRNLTPTAIVIERVVGSIPDPPADVPVFIQSRTESGPIRRAVELLRMVRELQRRGYSRFFVRTSQTAAVPVALATRLFGGETMYWSCGELCRAGLRGRGWRHLLRSELPMRLAFGMADRVVTGTESLADHYSVTFGIPRRRVAVLPNDVSLADYRPPGEDERGQARESLGVGGGEPVVLLLHRMSPVRRTLLYIPTVLVKTLEQIPSARFVIAGGGPDEDAVRAAVGGAGIADRVVFTGAVPHRMVRRLYHAADAFAMTSYTEGFPRVLLEAMAMAVPFVATSVGGVPEVVAPLARSRLVSRDDPATMSERLVEVLRDHGLAAALTAEGLEWVRRYDSPGVAAQLVALGEKQ
jgi:glycosyltransferase involved in cell wall biosynthesis